MEPTDAQIARRLQDILQSPEFAVVPETLPDWAQALKKWLAYVLTWLNASSDPARFFLLLVSLALLVALVARAVVALRRARVTSSPLAPAVGRAHAQTPSATHIMQRAHALAKGGQLRDAARALLQAVLVRMCAQRALPWRASRADWEWVALLRPDARTIAFIRAAQHLAFGPHASADDYQACAREAQALLDVPVHPAAPMSRASA